MTERLIVAITGASGAIFGVRTLERAREFDLETHLILSAWGAKTLQHEAGLTLRDMRQRADVVHRPTDQGAPVSSGSYETLGMVVAPCSVRALAAIANGMADDLVTRAADVVIKERRQLVLMVRESPLSAIHLENMLKLSRLGVTILPPMPAFYNHPASLDDMVDHVVTRTLDQFRLRSDRTPRWDGRMSRSSGSDEGH